MTITPKTHTAALRCGCTLVRHYVGSTPDEVGTVAQWQQAADEMDEALGRPAGGDPNLGPNVELHIYHMDSPELVAMTQAGQSNLEDGEPGKAGYQPWSGSCTADPDGSGPKRARLEIGCYPDNWKPEDAPMLRPITAAALARSIGVLGHEGGHRTAHPDRFDLHGGAQAAQHLTGLWRTHRSGAGHNEPEGFAEDVRAMAGPLSVRGTFSDGRIYTRAMNPRLYTVIRCGPTVRRSIGAVDTGNFMAWDDRLLWQQFDWVWDYVRWEYVRTPGAWFSIDHQLRRWRYTSAGTWQAA